LVEIVKVSAIINNEVAFVAWRTDPDPIPGCLGFHIVREYLDGNDNVTSERSLAAYVAFAGQSNTDWQPQNTGVWPVQKFNWRDLTLRRKRDSTGMRPENERLRYRVAPVGLWRAGLTEVTSEAETHWDPALKQRVPNTYAGAPVKLGYLGPAAYSNIVVGYPAPRTVHLHLHQWHPLHPIPGASAASGGRWHAFDKAREAPESARRQFAALPRRRRAHHDHRVSRPQRWRVPRRSI
jgi:hypothetical protein